MGRKKKIRSGAGDLVAVPGPLDRQIEKSRLARQKLKMENDVKALNLDDELLEDDDQMEQQLNVKIVSIASKQWKEDDKKTKAVTQTRGKSKKPTKISLTSNDSDDDPEEEVEDESVRRGLDDLEQELLQISPEDELAAERFLDSEQSKAIKEKIDEKKVTFKEQLGGGGDIASDINPEVVALYKEVGLVMAKYRSGKVPKAFKMIPSMVNWEDLLFLTCPESWSAGAMLQATRIFSSCMSPAMCQRFYNIILLPRVRDEISEYRKLNYHIYECLFKAIFKPSSFFKGIMLPLCDPSQPRLCTLREAWIVGSILRKISIPVLHAAAAMLKIAEMDYYGPSSYILRILIEKRYTLPFRVLDGLVFHFLRMRGVQPALDGTGLAVLWHQTLLSFVRDYKEDISSEQREALLDLIKIHSHHQITLEVRRYLQHAESRNEESEANVPAYAKEDGMDF